MARLTRTSLSFAICATVAATAMLPGQAGAGVMSIADKATVSLPTHVQDVDWRPYQHRHHRWHYGWHYGWPRYRYGYYDGWNTAYAPPARPAYAPAGAAYGYSPGYYGGSAWGFNPLGAIFGAAADVATAPVWATETALGYPTSPPYRWW